MKVRHLKSVPAFSAASITPIEDARAARKASREVNYLLRKAACKPWEDATDRYIERQVVDQATLAFKEDLVVADAIQERIDSGILPKPTHLRMDAGRAQAHMLLERMLAAEQAAQSSQP